MRMRMRESLACAAAQPPRRPSLPAAAIACYAMLYSNATVCPPRSKIAPLGCVMLVFNSCVAPSKERAQRRRQLRATLLMLAGCLLAVAFSSHRTPTYSMHAIQALLQHHWATSTALRCAALHCRRAA